MVSLVVSAMLVGMILAVFSRMTLAYRGQQGVAELQQILAAAQSMIERDLRMAGNQMPEGFFLTMDTSLHQPVQISNNADGFGPDELRIFYADTGAQARVETINGASITAPVGATVTTIEVDDSGDFLPGDLIVLSRSMKDQTPDLVRFRACVLQIEQIAGNTLQIDGAGTWGSTTRDHCRDVRQGSLSESHMVYRFRARGYRIDPDRRDLAVLQFSPTGGLVDDWQDLGVGFTDLQVASRWDDTADPLEAADTDDLDSDGTREWYSDLTQDGKTNPLVPIDPSPAQQYLLDNYDDERSFPVGLRVSLVVRTHSKVDVVPSQRTPALIDPARAGNNDLGDRDAVQLEGVPDTSRPIELRGEHVYRYATIGVDLRNMGVNK